MLRVQGKKERDNHSDFNLGNIIKEIWIYLYEELFDIEKVLHTLEKLEDPEFEIFKFYVEKEGPQSFFLILFKVSRQFFANMS